MQKAAKPVLNDVLKAFLPSFLTFVILCFSSNPAASSERMVSLVLLPSERAGQFSEDHWKSWLSLLEKDPALRLTIAFSPQDLDLLAREKTRLMALESKGRLEPALRLNGDPPLPLIYDLDLAKIYLPTDLKFPQARINWQDDVLGRIAREKINFRSFWNELPKGFVPGGGSLNPPIAEFLEKQNFHWCVASFPESSWPADQVLQVRENSSETLCIYNAHPVSKLFHSESLNEQTYSRALSELKESGGNAPEIIVFDEAHSSVSMTSFLNQYRERIGSSGGFKMILCSEAAKISETKFTKTGSGATAVQIWPYSWAWIKGPGMSAEPGLEAWIGSPDQNQAWELLSKTRNDIDRYRNSGSAVLEKLDKVMDEFYSAESGEFFEGLGKDPGPKKTEMSDRFKAILSDIGNSLSRTPPPPPQSMTKEENSIAPEVREGTLVKSRSKTSLSWSQAGKDSILRNFSVSVSPGSLGEDLVSFDFSLGKWKDSMVIDLYIDVNHIEGAGNTDLLPGRNASVPPADGWEFALVNQWTASGGWQSRLYRSNSEKTVYSVSANPRMLSSDENSFEVLIPKKLIGADPMIWGYLAVALDSPKGPILDILGYLRTSPDSTGVNGGPLPLMMLRNGSN